MDYFLEKQLEIVEVLASKKKIKFIQIDDDLAFKSALMVKKEKFIELYFDRMEKLIKLLKDKDILIAYHTDGKLDDIGSFKKYC